MKNDLDSWNRKYPKGKAFLSWNAADYLAHNLDPTPAVLSGKTEGEIMEQEEIESWYIEEMRCLSVFQEEYPEKFKEQLKLLQLDLEYLKSLGKISQEELEKLMKKDNFNFGS